MVVSSDRLIDELWGERPPDTAATALHGLVSQLRKVLEPDRVPGAPGSVLVTRAPGYMLRVDPEAVDATRFERLALEGRDALAAGEAGRASAVLRAALGLWRGQALAGIDETAPRHAEARRLEELRLEALEDRIDADLAQGRNGALVSELEALLEREPLRERPRGQLMLALYRAGRQAEALDLYRETRRRLVDELGIEPTPRLRELEQAILAQDPELDAGLPRLRPPMVLRGRSKRLVLGMIAVAIAVTAAATGILLAGGDGATVLAAPGSVAVVDAETARLVDTIEVGSGPVAIAFGHDSLWVANSEDDTVSRIDAATREVEATIGVASPVDLAASADAIWVASGIAGTVSRIDPESNDVVATIDLRSPEPFNPRTVHGVAAGAGGVWAAVTGRELVRIDPARDQVARSIDVGSDQLAAAVGHGALWVVTARGQLLRIEPTTGAVTTRLSVGSPGSFLTDVVAADDGVLVLVNDIWLVDPESTRLDRTLSIGGFITAVADAPGPGVWAVAHDGTLARLDPDLAEAPVREQLGPQPTALAVAFGAIWVTIGEPEP
ncbi:MAG: winged helix-turn-helix domain-containing protein [Actinobacteria bacterium]|nr:winged helix-turn-helix domain-containing protein [Actinomycetota bacterium]